MDVTGDSPLLVASAFTRTRSVSFPPALGDLMTTSGEAWRGTSVALPPPPDTRASAGWMLPPASHSPRRASGLYSDWRKACGELTVANLLEPLLVSQPIIFSPSADAP